LYFFMFASALSVLPSTKKRGSGVLVYWCLTLVTFLTVWPISAIADAMSSSGVEEWRFRITTLSCLSDCG
jgi:hypothetical protein